MIPLEKQMLRSAVRETLRGLTPADRAAHSARIAEHLRPVEGLVFGFAPLRSEPDWLMGWPDERLIALPRVRANGLEFFSLTVGEARNLSRGPFGAPEPPDEPARRVALADAAVLLVPGLAFDAAGRRLGRGGGYYDRVLADGALRARRVGVCFACQLVPAVSTEDHDMPVDAVVSEAGWSDAQGSGSGRG